jgi:hydroxymethylglutaryl-CoA lyase
MITIEEQGPRDGFQVEKKMIPTEMKIEIIEKAVDAGLKRIQMCSFVNPKLVPQMADADELCANIKQKEGIIYSGLVLNTRGVERAAKAGLKHLSISISASNTHSIKNTGKTIEESLKEFSEMVRLAKEANIAIRGGIQCAFGCRYEGAISEDVVIELAQRHLDHGIDEISLADSTGMGNPTQMKRVLARIKPIAQRIPIAMHLHDTEGKGLANLVAAIESGATIFDTAFGGLGGCPFIKGASGNIATEDTVWMLRQMGIETGINLPPIIEISHQLEVFLEKKLPGKIKDITGL